MLQKNIRRRSAEIRCWFFEQQLPDNIDPDNDKEVCVYICKKIKENRPFKDEYCREQGRVFMNGDIDMTQVYFLKNKDWYYSDYDDEECMLKLTELGKKNPKAVASYNEFYKINPDWN